jgi:hypothetical protein
MNSKKIKVGDFVLVDGVLAEIVMMKEIEPKIFYKDANNDIGFCGENEIEEIR